MKTILIIDTYGLFFRAYYAVKQEIKSPISGQINAIFGFLSSILQIIQTIDHDSIIFALDAGGKGLRHELFPEYKANRSKCPEDLIPQFALLDELLASFDVDAIKKNGLEADDIINTLAKQIESDQNKKSVIVTFDKDLCQLVSQKTCIYNPKTKSFIHESDVIDIFGVKASQISSFLALTGDAIDNIPGVPNIGKKTAISVLKEFENIADIYNNLEKLPIKTAKILTENQTLADMSLSLTELIFDPEIDIANHNTFKKLNLQNPSQETKDFLTKHQLKSFYKRFGIDNAVTTSEKTILSENTLQQGLLI